MIRNLLAIFICGGLGTICRYLVTQYSKAYFKHYYIGTFIVNIIGCLLIGYLYALTMNKAGFLSPQTKLCITVGFLGGLTTFSTFNLECFCLINEGQTFKAIIYAGLSLIIGLIAVALGYYTGNQSS